MAAEEHVSPEQFRLYRGEGSHEKTSYYPKKGPDALAGAWYTTDRASAHRYAKSTVEGKVYSLDVHPHEAEQRGLPKNFVVTDPAVRSRRMLDQ